VIKFLFQKYVLRRDVRYGDWFQTFSGVKFYPLDPREDEIVIEDIAHSLSNQCRFAGHCRFHYSVGQHSLIGSYLKDCTLPLHFLLHDAAEAYIVDLPRPIKRTGLFGFMYRAFERRLNRLIERKFKLGPRTLDHPHIKWLDSRLLITEKRDVMGQSPAEWKESELEFAPLPDYIRPFRPDTIERQFLARYFELDSARPDARVAG
jgi:hypothetical protein